MQVQPQDAADIDELERLLAPLAHSKAAREIVQNKLDQFKKTGPRLEFLNRVLLRAPILYEDAVAALTPSPEPFSVLQGDVLRTDAAYVLGVQRTGNPSYVLATSTCAAVIGRRPIASLLEVAPVRQGSKPESELKSDLALLSRYRRNDYFYLPRLRDDENDVLFNVVHLDHVGQCDNQALEFAQRRASMTVIGWRIFGSLLRDTQVREAEDEVAIRRVAMNKVA